MEIKEEPHFTSVLRREFEYFYKWLGSNSGWDFQLIHNYDGDQTLEPGTQLEFDFMKE